MSYNDKPLTFGKHKGRTIKQLFDAGELSYLDWMRSQEIKDDKFKAWAISRKKYIDELLEMAPNDDGKEPEFIETVASGTITVTSDKDNSIKNSLKKIKEAVAEIESWL